MDKKEYKKQWYEKNKDRLREKAKQHYLENKEQKKEYARKWREENREHHREYSRQWQASNKELAAARLKKWYKDNPGMRAYYSSSRKKAVKQATPKWLSDFDQLKIKCLYQVSAMYSRESDQAWHVDHIVPLKGKEVCGLHVPWNLRVIPATDNIKKSNKHYD